MSRFLLARLHLSVILHMRVPVIEPFIRASQECFKLVEEEPTVRLAQKILQECFGLTLAAAQIDGLQDRDNIFKEEFCI